MFKVLKDSCYRHIITLLELWLGNLEKEIAEKMEKLDKKGMIYAIKDSYTPMTLLEQVKECPAEVWAFGKGNFIKLDVHYPGLQSKMTAEILKEALVVDVEFSTFDAYEALDAYNFAIKILCENNDIENEAQFLIRAGAIYYKNLKDNQKHKFIYHERPN